MHWILCFFCYIVCGTLNIICIHAVCSFEDSTYPPTYLGDGWDLDCWFTQQCLNWCIGYRDYIESSLSCNIGRTVVAIAVFRLLFFCSEYFSNFSPIFKRTFGSDVFSTDSQSNTQFRHPIYMLCVYTALYTYSTTTRTLVRFLVYCLLLPHLTARRLALWSAFVCISVVVFFFSNFFSYVSAVVCLYVLFSTYYQAFISCIPAFALYILSLRMGYGVRVSYQRIVLIRIFLIYRIGLPLVSCMLLLVLVVIIYFLFIFLFSILFSLEVWMPFDYWLYN